MMKKGFLGSTAILAAVHLHGCSSGDKDKDKDEGKGKDKDKDKGKDGIVVA